MKILVLMLLSSSCVYPFAYDSAIHKAQKGNWQDAHSALSSIITDNPDRADVMYDVGVAAYNLGNKCQAATCFARAAECSADKNITFCAHFNAGNLYVDEKKLERALEEYDKALAIEPGNEYARHNRDRVAQMLEEQKQEQNKDQEKQDQEKDQQNGEQNSQDQQQDQKNDQGQDQQNQNGNDQSSSAKATEDRQGQDGKQNQNGNEKQNKDGSSEPQLDKQTQSDGEQQADTTKQGAEHGDNPKDKHHNAGDDQKRNGNNEFDEQTKDTQKEGHEQQGDKHNTTPEQANVSDDKSNGSAQDGQELALNDPWLLKILDNQEMHDKAVNKQLMEARIRQHGGKNGQNCW